jgi:hypothetical protein
VPWCLCGENVPGLVRLAVTECVRTGPFDWSRPQLACPDRPAEAQIRRDSLDETTCPVPRPVPLIPIRSRSNPVPLMCPDRISTRQDQNGPVARPESMTLPQHRYTEHTLGAPRARPAVGAQSRFFHSATKLRFVQDQFSTRRASSPSKDAHAVSGAFRFFFLRRVACPRLGVGMSFGTNRAGPLRNHDRGAAGFRPPCGAAALQTRRRSSIIAGAWGRLPLLEPSIT